MSDIQCGQKLTNEQFARLFNSISDDYSVFLHLDGEVTIRDSDYRLEVAQLGSNCQFWLFEYKRAYSWQELTLMTQLAATPPELRGENHYAQEIAGRS